MIINKKRFFTFVFVVSFIAFTGVAVLIAPWNSHKITQQGNINVNGIEYNLTYDGQLLVGNKTDVPMDLTVINNSETKIFYHEFKGKGDSYLIKINTTLIDQHLNESAWDGFNITVSRGPGGNASVPTHEFVIDTLGSYGINITYKVNASFIDPGYPFQYNLTYEITRL